MHRRAVGVLRLPTGRCYLTIPACGCNHPIQTWCQGTTTARLVEPTDPDLAAAARLIQAQRRLEPLIPEICNSVWSLRGACGVTAEHPGAHLLLAGQFTPHVLPALLGVCAAFVTRVGSHVRSATTVLRAG